VTAALRPIDPAPFAARIGKFSAAGCGSKPQLRWIGVDLLRIDPAYQREIMQRGAKNIIRIAQEFDWAMFAPVVVAETDKGIYLIIDGQHRATAAALRGIKDVPCAIVTADARKQAAAFAAINAQITAVSSLQLHAARLAAGDSAATALTELCAEAGVTICRYPVPANKMKAGETLAAGTLPRLMTRYGGGVLKIALKCITCAGERNVGMVRAQIVEAICCNLEAEPDWLADESRLIAAMQRFDLPKAYRDAFQNRESKDERITSRLVDAIADHLDKAFGAKAA
jgi:hypothetical protein